MTPRRRIKTLFFRLHQQYHRCFYCGCDLSYPGVEITTDHVIPLSAGADNEHDTPENIVACCPTCNKAKGRKMPSAEVLARLKVANSDLSESAVEDHFQKMLRVSAEAARFFDKACRLK